MVKKFGVTTHMEPRRVERGPRTGWYSLPTGAKGKDESYRRVTTMAGAAEYMGNLERRTCRFLVEGLSRSKDLVARAGTLTQEDAGDLDRIVRDALSRTEIDASANMGTAFHSIVEARWLGKDVEIPEEWKPIVDDYFLAIREAGYEAVPELLERTVLHPTYGVAGRFDMILRNIRTGELVMADNKTGKAPFTYGVQKMTVQLWTYVDAPLMWDPIRDEMVEKPTVNREKAIIVHIPLLEGGPVTVNELPLRDGPELADTCLRVLGWRATKVKVVTIPRGPVEGYLARVEAAETKAELRSIRDEAKAAGEWTNELSDAVMTKALAL